MDYFPKLKTKKHSYSRMPVLLWHSKPRQRHHKNKTMGQYPYEYGNKNPSNKQKESSNT